ncbi:hypothetical protein [Streptomyces sp. NPDC018347]|uniref:hypothetical protein n=1 Tax=Streptomyces sp. NPDC018347 TaxID=3157193 RepID=UPI00340342C1
MKFDADTGRLDVAPDAPAYGTKVRWIAPKLIAAANEKAPGANVRTLHVLPPTPGKAGPATAAADPASPPPTPAAPEPMPRSAPSAGYRRALEAHRQAVQPVPGAAGCGRLQGDQDDPDAHRRSERRMRATATVNAPTTTAPPCAH